MISLNIASNVSEKQNLLHFLLLHPFYLVRFAVRSPSIFLMYLLRREIRNCRTKNRKNNFRTATEKNKGLSFEQFPGFVRTKVKDIDDFEKIELAGSTISSRQQPDWSYINEDIENTFSHNRFGWLLTAIYTRTSAKLAQRALEWITNWIDTMGESFHHPVWESYSVSERLANWPFILRVCERFQTLNSDAEKKIAKAIGTHVDYLLNNLELRDEFTNNHILNNARGLYIGGLAVAHERAIEKAKELFIEWTPKLFHNDGMSREGSSHYQFLLCQRFEQICLLAHLDRDDNFATFIKKWTDAIRNARDLLNIQNGESEWAMPFIGDISPDYKPLWFSPLSTDGWEVIKNSYAGGDFFTSPSQTMIAGLRRMSGGIFRYDRDDATIFWHVPDGPVTAGSHGHFDVGSFIFFLKGREIFADPGRLSYSAEGSGGKYAKAHSCLLVDGLGAFCEDLRLNLIEAYPYQKSHLTIDTDADGLPVMSMYMDGFRRLSSPVFWKRSFSFKERTMTIRDDIGAKGSHKLETKFIIAEGLSAEKTDEGVRIKSECGQITMKVLNPCGAGDLSFSIERAEISREYGRLKEALAFVVKNTIQGNHINIYNIQWQA